ncbi:MAG: hypothetical protein LUC97_07175 [Clostridiales bacterium]|nr:hypothetical protein [Clostridiales bacterium]
MEKKLSCTVILPINAICLWNAPLTANVFLGESVLPIALNISRSAVQGVTVLRVPATDFPVGNIAGLTSIHTPPKKHRQITVKLSLISDRE